LDVEVLEYLTSFDVGAHVMGREQRVVFSLEDVLEFLNEWKGKKHCIISLNPYTEVLFSSKVIVIPESLVEDKWCLRTSSSTLLFQVAENLGLESYVIYGREARRSREPAYYLVSRDVRLKPYANRIGRVMIPLPYSIKPTTNEEYHIIARKLKSK